MPRKLRLEFPGAIYHVLNRGDRREDIFRDEEDRRKFLATLDEACQKTGWQVHAYCLMRHHFHLVIETPEKNLVAGMKWDEAQLTRRRKGDRHKVALARRLRAETTMSLAWIARRLQMGSWSYVSNLLGQTKTKSANSED